MEMKKAKGTLKVLVEIRDAIRQTNSRIEQTRVDLTGAIQDTNARLDQTNARLSSLEHHVVENEIRLATSISALAGDLGAVKTMLRERRDLSVRVDRCEQDIAEIRQTIAQK